MESLSKKEKRELKRQEKLGAKERSVKTRLLKRVAIWGSAFLLLGGAIAGVFYLDSAEPSQPALLLDAVSPSDRYSGSKDAKVVLIEYSDFQCPACGHYYPLVKQVKQEFGDGMQFVYRHFPLPSHKNAELAARASEAAGAQNKFWEMHDAIFEHQEEWSGKSSNGARSDFKQYAEKLGLDAARFESDLDSDEVKNKVENDRQSGLRSKVNSTPTFFLNGQKIQNPRSYDEFKSFISDALVK